MIRFNLKNTDIPTGYDSQNISEFSIPSCGVEDLDRAVFNLFEKEMPLYFKIDDETRKVPVVFASGERFALLRRNKPLTDNNGALILPLISISRSSIDIKPAKGISNNEMYPHTVIKRIHKKSIDHRINNNFENLNNTEINPKIGKSNTIAEPTIENNIIEFIEIPPVKYFGCKYDIVIWSSFIQQINQFTETIASSFNLYPGGQVRLDSDKGYWFPGFFENNIQQENNFTEFTDAERFIKATFSINATGYIINPEIDGIKSSLSYMNATNVSFEFLDQYENVNPNQQGVASIYSNILTDIDEDGNLINAGIMGINEINNEINLLNSDKSNAFIPKDKKTIQQTDNIGEWANDYKTKRKSYVNVNNKKIPVMEKRGIKGESVYDQTLSEVLFNTKNK